MAPTRRSARHASAGTPTSAQPSPASALLDNLDNGASFGLLHDDPLLNNDGSLLLGDDDMSFSNANNMMLTLEDSIPQLPMDLGMDLDMPLGFNDDMDPASVILEPVDSQPGNASTVAEDPSTESDDAADDVSNMEEPPDHFNVEEEEEYEEGNVAHGQPEIEDFGDDIADLHRDDFADGLEMVPSPATSSSAPLRRGRTAEPDDSHAEDEESGHLTDSQRPSKRQKRRSSHLARSARSSLRKRSRSSSTLSSALSDVTGLVSKTENSIRPDMQEDRDLQEEDDGTNQDQVQVDKDRRDAAELSRLRRGSPDSEFSASASEEDEDDVPLQAIVSSKVSNNIRSIPATSGGSKTTTSSRKAPSTSQAGKKGRKGHGHNRKPSGSISQGSAVRMPTNTAQDIAIAEEQAAKQPNKSLGSSRTVPDLQPGTPHADLHNDTTEIGPNGEPPDVLNEAELRQAIGLQVKLEEEAATLEQAVSRAPATVEALVRGQAVDDEEIIQDVSAAFQALSST